MQVVYTKSGKHRKGYFIEVGCASIDDADAFQEKILSELGGFRVFATGTKVRYVHLTGAERTKISNIADRYFESGIDTAEYVWQV